MSMQEWENESDAWEKPFEPPQALYQKVEDRDKTEESEKEKKKKEKDQ